MAELTSATRPCYTTIRDSTVREEERSWYWLPLEEGSLGLRSLGTV